MIRDLSIALAATGVMAGCASAEGLPFERDAPPQILTPASVAGIVDRRGRFREIFCAISQRQRYARPCAETLHTLSGEAAPTAAPVASGPPANRRRIVIIPGIFGECAAHIATPFKDAVKHLQDQGYQVDLIPVSGRSSSAANALVISTWLAAHVRPGERLLLLGYSKGTSDIVETLQRHARSIPAGTAIVSVAGVVAGTPAADRWERAHGAIAQLPLPGCGPGDGAGMASITRRERMAWLARYPLPRQMHYYSLAAFAPRNNVSRVLKPFHAQLSAIDAWNDGQVIHHDAIIPGSYLLGYLNADHWAVTLPLARYAPWLGRTLVNRNEYPRTVLLEAIVRAVEEEDSRRP